MPRRHAHAHTRTHVCIRVSREEKRNPRVQLSIFRRTWAYYVRRDDVHVNRLSTGRLLPCKFPRKFIWPIDCTGTHGERGRRVTVTIPRCRTKTPDATFPARGQTTCRTSFFFTMWKKFNGTVPPTTRISCRNPTKG